MTARGWRRLLSLLVPSGRQQETRVPKPRDGTDLSAVADKRISVTALRLDLTDEPFMTRLSAAFK